MRVTMGGALEQTGRPEDEVVEYDYSGSCGCLRRLWSRPHGYVLYEEEQQEVKHENWLEKKLKKVKVLSEVLGGPKWKNFIRCRANKKSRMQFQYDPKSYSLNFDNGTEKVDGDAAYVGFWARYADPLPTNKVELGV